MKKFSYPALFPSVFISVFFLACFYFYALPYFGQNFNMVPGDLGDARLNNYFLEHGFLWLNGTVNSFWDAPFFFPVKNTISFSDNHLGTLPFYAVWRALGCDRETAFQLWIVFGFVLNFFSMAWVLKQLGIRLPGICTGAFIFTFSSVMLHQIAHAQLLYRFALPLCFYFSHLFLKNLQPKYFLLFLFFLAWQFYCSIYIGYFTVLFLTAFTPAILILNRKKVISKVSHLNTATHMKNILGLCLFIMALAVLLGPYISTSNNGAANSTESVFTMLPRPASYLISQPSHPVFGKNYSQTKIPMRHEHVMYLGLLPWLSFFFYCVASKNEPERKPLITALIISICFLIVLTLYLNGYSLYSFMIMLPGVTAIRAVSRIVLVLLLPFSLLAAFFISYLTTRASSNRLITAVIIILAFILFIENLKKPYSYPKKLAQSRIAEIKKQLPEKPEKNSVLIYLNQYAKTHQFPIIELDAMLAAQDLGIKTLNGYSGQIPQGYQWMEGTGNIHAALYGLIRNNPHMDFQNPMDCILLFKIQSNKFKTVQRQQAIDLQSIPSTPLPDEAFLGDIRTYEEKIIRKCYSPFFLTAIVTNQSKYIWPATGSQSVKLSYRWGNSLEHLSTQNFDSRIWLPHDLRPGESAKIIFSVGPKFKPGNYFMEFDLLQEHVSWFADKGNKTTIINIRLKS